MRRVKWPRLWTHPWVSEEMWSGAFRDQSPRPGPQEALIPTELGRWESLFGVFSWYTGPEDSVLGARNDSRQRDCLEKRHQGSTAPRTKGKFLPYSKPQVGGQQSARDVWFDLYEETPSQTRDGEAAQKDIRESGGGLTKLQFSTDYHSPVLHGIGQGLRLDFICVFIPVLDNWVGEQRRWG